MCLPALFFTFSMGLPHPLIWALSRNPCSEGYFFLGWFGLRRRYQ